MQNIFLDANPSVFGVRVINSDLNEFHISINVPVNAEIHFQNLEKALNSCKNSNAEKCFFHILQKPCTTFIGKALLFYKDFSENLKHEVSIVYYDEETKRLLDILKLGAIFNIYSKECFEKRSIA